MKGQKKKLRLPKVLLERANTFLEETGDKTPETAEEYYNEAVSNEESGDRWFSSDLSKALRFYQRGHINYKQALELDPRLVDALFNLPRLQFDIYNKYIKDDSVILDDLENCAEALNDTKPGGLIQNLDSLCKSFENYISIANQIGNVSWDFYYNAALCYSEYLDQLCQDTFNVNDILVVREDQTMANTKSEVCISFERCIYWFSELLDYFKLILGYSGIDNRHRDESVSLDIVTQVCIDSYRLLSTFFETLNDEKLISIGNIIENGRNFIIRLDEISSGLIQSNFCDSLLHDLKLAKLSERASRALNFRECEGIWNSEVDLNDKLDKKLLETSAYRSFLDKFESSSTGISHLERWYILTTLNDKYKFINEELKLKATELEKSRISENDVLSSTVSQLCAVLIERADIDLERSLLSTDGATKNRNILQNNSKNFLKNAVIYSKKSGGIRESISGKMLRIKRRREALMRLCLLDRKSQEEWDTIVGAKYWPMELQDLSFIEAYRSFIL